MRRMMRRFLSKKIRLAALAMSVATVMTWSAITPAIVGADDDDSGKGPFGEFSPLPASTACTSGGNPEQPFVLPPGFKQTVFARGGDGGTVDLWDMNTQNETGRLKGRFLYRTHEVAPGSQVSVTDLRTVREVGGITTSDTRILAQRADWERFDGIAWTPWGTILAAEETNNAAIRDPEVPEAVPAWSTRFSQTPETRLSWI